MLTIVFNSNLDDLSTRQGPWPRAIPIQPFGLVTGMGRMRGESFFSLVLWIPSLANLLCSHKMTIRNLGRKLMPSRKWATLIFCYTSLILLLFSSASATPFYLIFILPIVTTASYYFCDEIPRPNAVGLYTYRGVGWLLVWFCFLSEKEALHMFVFWCNIIAHLQLYSCCCLVS